MCGRDSYFPWAGVVPGNRCSTQGNRQMCRVPDPSTHPCSARKSCSDHNNGSSNRLFTMAFPVVPGLGSPISVPSVSAFDHEKLPLADRPCEKRCVTFTCSASYQVLPIGFQ